MLVADDMGNGLLLYHQYDDIRGRPSRLSPGMGVCVENEQRVRRRPGGLLDQITAIGFVLCPPEGLHLFSAMIALSNILSLCSDHHQLPSCARALDHVDLVPKVFCS